MRGVDVSHWNQVTSWSKVRAAGNEFCFIKATEGTSYLDPTFKVRKDQVRNAGMLLGVYHFAKATNPIAEADWFVSQVGELQPGEIVVLDYETYSLTDPASWCLLWIQRVEQKLGFKPLLYTYHGLLTTYNWKKVSDYNVGLWAARYGLQQQEPNQSYRPATGSFPFYMCWQYCSKGVVPGIVGFTDLNTTEITLETMKKYGKPSPQVICNHQCPAHCPPL